MPRVSLPAALMSTVCLLLLALRAGAETDAYPRATQQGGRIVETRLTIARETVTIAGVTAEAMTVDGGIPGPTLRWRVGDLARVHFGLIADHDQIQRQWRRTSSISQCEVIWHGCEQESTLRRCRRKQRR